VGVAATSLVAICFGLTLLNAHRADRRKLDKTICERDSLHEQSIEILAKLNTSLVQVENYNRQLRLIGDFAMQIQECETEQKIFETVENLFPAMFVTDGGSLYCPTPEATLERTVRWPKLGTSGRVIHPRRCPAVRNTCRIQGEFAACESCRLADPRKVACIPLRTGRNITGLLQLSFPDSYSAYPRHSSQNSIIRMAADQLSLALSNVTSRKNLGDMVMRDGLTGAFNRRYMEEALQREIARSRRSKSPISLLMVDLDHFKQLNDSMGHAAGDSVLKELARTLANNVRVCDIVCRYGGEEFLIAFPDTSALSARGRADELRRHIHEVSSVVKHHRLISASIGVAAMPEHGTDLKTLMRAADDALYDAKHSGRDRVVIAKSQRSSISPSLDVSTIFV
jgi:diguanylate cyclase (GGDEF)-like protein